MQSMFCTKEFYFIFVHQIIKKWYLTYKDMQNLQSLSISLSYLGKQILHHTESIQIYRSSNAEGSNIT